MQSDGQQFERRAGLSADPRTRPLLSMVNGKRREEQFRPPIRPPPPRPTEELTEDEVLAPPKDDTDSEVDDPVPPRLSQPKPPGLSKDIWTARRKFDTVKPKDSSDTDDEQAARRSRADIKPYFGTSKAGKEQARKFTNSQESNSGPRRYGSSQISTVSTLGSKRSSSDLDSPSPPSKRNKLSASQPDERNTSKGAKRSKASTYSSKEKEKMERSKQQAKKLEEKRAAKREKKARSLTPKKVLPSFKSYDDDPFDKFAGNASPKRLINPGASVLSSPPASPRKELKVHSSLSPESSPKRTVKPQLKDPSGSLPSSLASSSQEKATSDSQVVPEARPAFKTFEDLFPDMSDTEDELEKISSEKLAVKAPCPLCKAPVDKDFLHSFSKGARLSVTRQIYFCRLHKKKSAEDAWKARGYPAIDWDNLSSRLTNHFDFLKDIINGSPSYYGAMLSDTVKEGKNRTLLKAEGSLTPGYYGPRGLRALSEDIIGRFSSTLRKRAVDDRLISSRGYSNYVQAVLVPELTVRLICEDMGVKTEEGRRILEESKEVGDMLHEDIGDTVDHVSEDEVDEL
ncbi:hypothetical protein CPLU01_07116 [Colletotrichum plurivorum]|uniref:Restriction of telomere capping protein 4 n=1 Tax=Colletotrichum plurivorum TaxID=2175906 RepID=A0A8H6KFY0_9PEZI|nr:hypothetical protein CPLU01_07116 [Colletotrichum plurivorum]